MLCITFMKRYLICWIGGLLLAVAGLIVAAWAFGAVWFDGPFGAGNKLAAALLTATFVVVLIFVRPFWKKLGVFVALFAGLLGWWLTLSPTNNANWQPDVAHQAWADVQGDEVTFHNVRNCDYRTETDYTPHWETRAVRLSQITGIDLAINYWGSPWIAHPIASFQFADAPPLCFSIEIRRKLGQSYSPIRGLYRQFELIYIVADERDVIRLRTNYRNEDVRLYRTTVSPAQARERFLNTPIRSMLCATNHAGITPSRPIAPPASAPSTHLTNVCRGTGASCSMAKATNCSTSATKSSPAVFPLPN